MTPTGGSTRLRSSLRTGLDVRVVGPLLGNGGPERWLGISVPGGPPDMRRYATDLRLGQPADGPRRAIHKSAYVDLGSVSEDEAGMRVEVSWRSASLAPLFPVFSGWLTVRAGELHLDGRYVPPGGPLGFVADRALMHKAARYTADWLLHELAHAAQPTSTGGARRSHPPELDPPTSH